MAQKWTKNRNTLGKAKDFFFSNKQKVLALKYFGISAPYFRTDSGIFGEKLWVIFDQQHPRPKPRSKFREFTKSNAFGVTGALFLWPIWNLWRKCLDPKYFSFNRYTFEICSSTWSILRNIRIAKVNKNTGFLGKQSVFEEKPSFFPHGKEIKNKNSRINSTDAKAYF